MVAKWIPLQSVLDTLGDTISGEFWSERTVLEHAARAMEMIGARVQYQTDVKVLQVSNHKALLPKGLVQINQIAYKFNGSLTAEDEFDIKKALGIDNEPYMQNSTLWMHSTWLQSPWNRDENKWKPLRLSTNTFALAIHQDNCVNFTAKCEHSYTVSTDGTITTSFKDGYIYISYLRYPMDCDGNFLIPDHEYYKEALRCYIMMRLWEYRMNMKEEGAGQLYLQYRDQWGLIKAKATAVINAPDLDEMENIRNIYNRIVPKYRQYYSFFGNLGKEESFNF